MVKDTYCIKPLSENWAKSGVNNGSTLLVHSNIKRTLVNAGRKDHSICLSSIGMANPQSHGSCGEAP